MDWLQFLQIICVPAFGWLFYKLGETRKELSDFKVEVAKGNVLYAQKYALKEDIQRMENKIDDLRDLIIEEMKKTSKRRA
ncbi:MAG: hypothetical protein IKN71_02535 [Alphaproteobacteria bacterium]|jgi:uncharacterized protein YdcH (DUF465 family)|nr:hypothetical protein [Alphaproteobacteria bacterium]